MRSPEKTPKPALYRYSISQRALLEKMSKVISLRERVAQAELDIAAPRLIKDGAVAPVDEPRSQSLRVCPNNHRSRPKIVD
jgi:hypothetical protein